MTGRVSVIVFVVLCIAAVYVNGEESDLVLESIRADTPFHQFCEHDVLSKRTHIRILAKKLEILLNQRKNIGLPDTIQTLLIYSTGGEGHQSAAQSMTDILMEWLPEISQTRALFHVQKSEPFVIKADLWNDALANEDLDQLEFIAGIKPFFELFYNSIAGFYLLLHQIRSVMNHPELILHTVPLGTAGMFKISQYLNSRFRLVPTDYQIDLFVKFLRGNNDSNASHLRVDIAFPSQQVLHTLTERNIPSFQVSGYPCRLGILKSSEQLFSSDEETRTKKREDDQKVLSIQGVDVVHDRIVFIMMGTLHRSWSKLSKIVRMIAELSDQMVDCMCSLHKHLR